MTRSDLSLSIAKFLFKLIKKYEHNPCHSWLFNKCLFLKEYLFLSNLRASLCGQSDVRTPTDVRPSDTSLLIDWGGPDITTLDQKMVSHEVVYEDFAAIGV